MKRQIKKSVMYTMYGISLTLLLTGFGIILFAYSKNETSDNFSTDDYVSKGIIDYEDEVQVVNVGNMINRPYKDSNVKIVKSYYDYLADAESQENSLIYYEGTYIQSSGVSYSNGEEFDVVSILPGVVKEIKEDDILGNSITIEHDNGIISIYQSISDILVHEGDNVTENQVLAKSSTSNISSDLNNHLYFEMIIDGVCVNPENYYSKLVSEIGQ